MIVQMRDGATKQLTVITHTDARFEGILIVAEDNVEIHVREGLSTEELSLIYGQAWIYAQSHVPHGGIVGAVLDSHSEYPIASIAATNSNGHGMSFRPEFVPPDPSVLPFPFSP